MRLFFILISRVFPWALNKPDSDFNCNHSPFSSYRLDFLRNISVTYNML